MGALVTRVEGVLRDAYLVPARAPLPVRRIAADFGFGLLMGVVLVLNLLLILALGAGS